MAVNSKATRKKQRKIGINQFLIVFSGLIIIVGGILTYFFVLRGVYGGFSISELVPDAGAVKEAISGSKVKIGILYSKYTENMLPEGSTWLNDNIATWKKFLDDANLKYDIVSDSTIELGHQYKYDLLILAGSKSLSDKEIMEIKKYVDKGGSIFATSGIASFSDNGNWRGWDFISEVFGLKFSKEIKNDTFTKIHTLRGGLSITAGIPTGYPLKVATWDRPISVEVMDPRTTQASFWYNYRLEDGLVRDNIKKSAGIVYGNYGQGRFVWMGFEINSVIGVQDDYIYFDRLFNNSIKWLTYKPIAFAKDWPVGYNAAAMIAPAITNSPENIKNLLNILKSEKVKATFFISPEQAESDKSLTKSLTKYGEVGSLVDIGYMNSINDTVNSLNDYNKQMHKLANAKATLEQITGDSVYGAYPLYGLFDRQTLKALIKDGYRYVITDSLTDRSVPNNIILGNDAITRITKTARDDYEIIRDFGLKQSDFQTYTYQEDLDRVLFEGGLYLFKMHTEYQCAPQNIGVVNNVIKDLKKKKFWIATGKEIQSWYAKKEHVEIWTGKRGPNRIVLTLSNPGKGTINNLVIQLNLNRTADKVTLSTEIIGTKKAQYDYDNKNNVVYIYINNLQNGESRTYYLDCVKPNS
ncbi:MAG: polysaccharide deacetylase family protein [Ignavibacteriaceae bacterium]